MCVYVCVCVCVCEGGGSGLWGWVQGCVHALNTTSHNPFYGQARNPRFNSWQLPVFHLYFADIIGCC